MDLERIRQAAERVAHSEGLEVVDVEWKVGRQRFLRVYIDHPPRRTQPEGASTLDSATVESREAAGAQEHGGSGVSHGDCERVSQQLSVVLDVEDLVPGPRYILEISSPGLDRKLTRPGDFQRFVGRLARISTTEPVENAKFFEGRLAGYGDDQVKIDVKGRVISVPFQAIRKANLVVEF